MVFAAPFGASTLVRAGCLVGLALHVGYVATATAVATVAFRRRGVLAATATATGLWVIAGLAITPYVGWGLFGAGVGGRAVLVGLPERWSTRFSLERVLAGRQLPGTPAGDVAYPDAESTAPADRAGSLPT